VAEKENIENGENIMQEVYHKKHLTTEQVIAIKEALRWMPIPKVAKQFNIPKANIRNIYLGVSYRNVGEV
jgi:hypothetical protein